MNLEHFKSFNTDDFILDDDFRNIVQNGTDEQLKEIMERFPEKNREINLSVKILKAMRPDETHHSFIKKNDSWLEIVKKQKRQKRIAVLKYAASLLFLLGMGSTAFYYFNKPKTIQTAAVNNSSNDALLILADGKTVSINSKESNIYYSKDGSGITVNDSSKIAQTASGEGLNQMIVPYGKRVFLMLSEGTKVWLNSGSKLVFPAAFKGKTREVRLEGEGYFEVAHNSEKPFFVKTEAFKMKVYGTKFNIQAYHDDNDYNVVLVEGKVSVNANSGTKEVFLAPNEKASVISGEENVNVTAVENMEVYTAWINGYLTFTNESVQDLLKRVARYYNVVIETRLPAKTENIYGKLDLKEDLERVLDGIAFISKTKYLKYGDKYVFMTN